MILSHLQLDYEWFVRKKKRKENYQKKKLPHRNRVIVFTCPVFANIRAKQRATSPLETQL
jgi:hypothetical protein